jgi:hypothetical protein
LKASWATIKRLAEQRGISLVVTAMSNNVDDLILDLLEWLGPNPRSYVEVIDAWRTSCPKLPVWEEANDRGYVERSPLVGEGLVVSVTDEGAEQLKLAHRGVGVT